MEITNKTKIMKELLEQELEELHKSFSDVKHNIKIKFGIDVNKQDLEWLYLYTDIYMQKTFQYFGRYSKIGKQYQSLCNKIETQYKRL